VKPKLPKVAWQYLWGIILKTTE